jgi:parallel beta-helix repeat protein
MKRYSANLALSVLVVVGVTVSVVAAGSAAVAPEPVVTVTVDCIRGKTIAKALTLGDERKPLIVVVRGTCNESVAIDRSDVTLRGEPGFGSAIHGPDSAIDTVAVIANRVTVENLEITGGQNGIIGIAADGLLVQGVTVQSTGRNGIAYISGSSGIIDGCTVQSNVRDGIVIESSSATITNCNISQNRNGVVVITGGSARIGVDNLNVPAANTINQNVQSGVVIGYGGQTIMAKNQITGNGAFGVMVSQGAATIAGLNNISGNVGQGINATQATVQIGNPAFGFSTVNKIEGNGSATSPGGVFGFVGTAMVIRDAVISGNNGFGLILSLRSQAQVINSTIQNNVPAGLNSGDGIRLVMGSGLFVAPPNSTVSGNAGWGLQCTDGESSVLNTSLLGLSGNGLGDLSPSCTAF